MAGTPKAELFTEDPAYLVIYRELLSSALPGKLPKQAPRMFITVLAALEQSVASAENPVCFRVFAWWLKYRTGQPYVSVTTGVPTQRKPSSLELNSR